MAQPATANGTTLPSPDRVPYHQEIHVVLDIMLLVICVVLGLIGWALHPTSHGFTAVPQDLRIVVAGSGFDVQETLTQIGDDGATLALSNPSGLSQLSGLHYVPLKNGDEMTDEGGPTAGGAAAVDPYPVVKLNGTSLPNERWAYIVLNPGSARPCDRTGPYRAGAVTLEDQAPPTPALVVAPLRPQPSVGSTAPPPGLCLQWGSDSPFNLSGPYLSARFPPLRGVSSTVPFTPQIPQTGDLGTGAVTRVLALTNGSNTANFNIQTDPHPQVSMPSSWTWLTTNSPQLIAVAAINSSDTQRETNNAFYSGVLFGVVGGALIGLFTDLVMPLHGRRRRIKRSAA